jgi:hypothetical protein
LMSADARQRWVPPDRTTRVESADHSKTGAATPPEIERI